MHIEPGFLVAGKIAAANVALAGIGGRYVIDLIKKPALWGRMGLAAGFFSIFMQAFHMPVGPSELHFVGAMAIYLTLGFIPTLFGFFVGLLLQGLLFEPTDLVHLSINSLSLIMPLLTVHYAIGRTIRDGAAPLTLAAIAKMDTLYYSGVTGMVGFWLFTGEVATPFAAWAAFAASYAPVVIGEVVFTYATVRLLKRHEAKKSVGLLFDVREMNVA